MGHSVVGPSILLLLANSLSLLLSSHSRRKTRKNPGMIPKKSWKDPEKRKNLIGHSGVGPSILLLLANSLALFLLSYSRRKSLKKFWNNS